MNAPIVEVRTLDANGDGVPDAYALVPLDARLAAVVPLSATIAGVAWVAVRRPG